RLVRTAHEQLFTPWGLRGTPAAGATNGGAGERVDPAWLGPFATAWLRVHDRAAQAQDAVRSWYDALDQASDRGVSGRIPEAFTIRDGAAPWPPAIPCRCWPRPSCCGRGWKRWIWGASRPRPQPAPLRKEAGL